MSDAVDASYATLNYEEQGGAKWAVGGNLDVKDGGTSTFGSGADATDGSNAARWARATYDFAVNGGAIGTIDLACEIPEGAIILDGVLDVQTAFTSGGSATVAIQTEAAADILAATAVASLTAGLADIVPDGTAANMVKTTAIRTVALVVATAALTAGKAVVHLRYVL